MNRPIRFRVWNNKDKTWVHGPGEECNLFGECILFGEFMSCDFETLNRCIPLQYTGVNAQNDKEIYEGDILQNQANRTFIVEYFHMSFHFLEILEKKIQPCSIDYIGDVSLCQIIGNKFENPELLQSP